MKMVHGIALPDTDTHFAGMIAANPLFEGKGTYQFGNLEPAVEVCTRNRLAVDVGAHVGLWTRVLASMFDQVIAFEPVPENIKCFNVNTAHLDNVKLYPWVVGKETGAAYISAVPENSGNAFINVPRSRLKGSRYRHRTSLDAEELPPVDFLKIDVEGYELFVIQGAREIIQRDKPVIVCEQKPANSKRYGLGDTDAIDLLKTWGYKVAWQDGEDYVLVPRNREAGAP